MSCMGQLTCVQLSTVCLYVGIAQVLCCCNLTMAKIFADLCLVALLKCACISIVQSCMKSLVCDFCTGHNSLQRTLTNLTKKDMPEDRTLTWCVL